VGRTTHGAGLAAENSILDCSSLQRRLPRGDRPKRGEPSILKSCSSTKKVKRELLVTARGSAWTTQTNLRAEKERYNGQTSRGKMGIKNLKKYLRPREKRNRQGFIRKQLQWRKNISNKGRTHPGNRRKERGALRRRSRGGLNRKRKSRKEGFHLLN